MSSSSRTPTAETASSAAVRFGTLQRKCACGQHTLGGGDCEGCKKEGAMLQRRSAGTSQTATAPRIVHEVMRSPGQPLDATTRAFFEPRFGNDLIAFRNASSKRHPNISSLELGDPADRLEREADLAAERVLQTR